MALIVVQQSLPLPSQNCLNKIDNNRELLENLLKSEPVDMAIIRWFQECKSLQYNISNLKKLNIDKAKDTLLKLHSIDNHSVEVIILFLDWSISDPFWTENILSISPLRRKKYDDEPTKFDKTLPRAKKVQEYIKEFETKKDYKVIEPFIL